MSKTAPLFIVIVFGISLLLAKQCDAAQAIPFQTLSTGQIQIDIGMNGGAPTPVLLDLGGGAVVLSAGEAEALNLPLLGSFTAFRWPATGSTRLPRGL